MSMHIVLCRRVAKSTGATVITTLADMEGSESFDASSLGACDEVSQRAYILALNLLTCIDLLENP